MNESHFWAIIESGGPYTLDDQEQQLASVRGQLRALPPEQVRDFYALFCRKMIDAQTWDLWGAAYVINGGCSDDGFVYFRAWLISQGKATYASALENPDTLAGVADPQRDEYEFELLYGLAREVYDELTGEEMPDIRMDWPPEPKGSRWDFDNDDEASRRLPRLTEVYRTRH